MSSPTPPAPAMRVTIKKGLEGQDDNLDLLQSYFEELRAVTVEPSMDLLTFATCTHYFGVITIEPGTQQDEGDQDAEGEPEEDSVDAGYIASPPPPSVTSSTASFSSANSAIRFGSEDPTSKPARSPATLEEEKVLKWREAFLAQLQEADDEEFEVEPLFSKGKMPERRNIQSFPEDRPNFYVPNNMGNDFDDYINWPDDIPSDEDSGDLNAQDGKFHTLNRETEVYSQLNEPRVLGREILEPEQFSSPMREIPEIPTDPKLKKFVYEEAIKFRDTLRAQRIQAYQEASASKPLFISPPKTSSKPIGVVYLTSSQLIDDPLHRGQLNIGIYVAPDYVKQRGLVNAVKEVVNEAFRDISCHRVQAIVVDHKTKLHTMELYTSIGLSREGVGRREFFSPVTHEWKDVFYFAILDTDWVCDNGRGASSSVRLRRPKSLWDDLLICQEREREELLRMEEKTLKRSNSIETIRDNAPITTSSIASSSRSETSSVTNSSVAASSGAGDHSPKRRRVTLKSGVMKDRSTRKSKTPSSSTSSMSTIDTMSTISSEWEIPARQTFFIPGSTNDALSTITPDAGGSTSSTGHWVMLDVSNDKM